MVQVLGHDLSKNKKINTKYTTVEMFGVGTILYMLIERALLCSQVKMVILCNII